VINENSSGTQCKAAVGTYCREVPDVSADADPYSGYVIYYNGSWTSVGGTGAAAALWAALMALTNASSACKGKDIGFANPALYGSAASSYPEDFTDITSGNNDYTPSGYTGGLYPAGTGYDMASGLGTPIASGLTAALCDFTGPNTIYVTNPGTQTTAVGAKVSLQIKAIDSDPSAILTYTAKGLPKGLKLNRTTGLIAGAPTKSGTSSVSVTVTDSTAASGSATFKWVHTSG
jgi:subtilase family serine protease